MDEDNPSRRPHGGCRLRLRRPFYRHCLSGGIVRLTYEDTTDRVSSLVRAPIGGGTSAQLDFTYDGSLVTGRTFTGVANGQFTYTYDNNFFLKQIDLASGSNSVTTPITRDADGLVTGYGPFTFTRSGPAGAVSQISDTALNISDTYDSLGRVSSRTHTVNGKNIYSIQLSYDSIGNISQKTETISGVPGATSSSVYTWSYTYDPDGQLLQAQTNGISELYGYDPDGNRTSYERPGQWQLSSGYDSQDRLV